MSNQQSEGWSRREFLTKVALAGTVGYLGFERSSLAAEPPPETTRIRLIRDPGICSAPGYVVKQLLPDEGFKDIQFVLETSVNPFPDMASGKVDIMIAFVSQFLISADSGAPITLLAGVHPGCYELFGTGQIRAIRDLKDKSVGVPAMGSGHHVFLASMAAYVGLDPRKDINWVIHKPEESVAMLAEHKVDALMAFAPIPQELRRKNIGHVIVNSAVDLPWSQYFCCAVLANREFVRKYPVATKRVLRAILKATDICALEPERAAKYTVDNGFTKEYQSALQTLKELPYAKWREYDPEDTVRFYALILHDIDMIKSSPNKIIAQATDWRFLRELKKELKG
jgi:NitT/TauT family transport system substrate-binding protein